LKIRGSGTRNKKKTKKNDKAKKKKRLIQRSFQFAHLEAGEGSEADSNGDNDEDTQSEASQEPDQGDGVSMDDADFLIPHISEYREKRQQRLQKPSRNRALQEALTKLTRLELLQKGGGGGGGPSNSNRKRPLSYGEADDDEEEEEEEEEEEDSIQDLEELLVRREEEVEEANEKEVDNDLPSTKKFSLRRYEFLYAVSFSGELKSVSNTLPRAVAVLSNSKRLFLGHLNVMLRCLDPAKAELCYIDTDSCVFSLTFSDLTRCLKPSKLEEWQRANLLADETAELSCHGKMKEEGLFARGQFKTLKIYRLYTQEEREQEQKQLKLEASYTRCKGIGRRVATKLPDSAFDSANVDRLVVHRNTLRPTRVGEIVMQHEARSLAVPFNLKRFVTSGALHSFPLAGPNTDKLTGSLSDSDLD